MDMFLASLGKYQNVIIIFHGKSMSSFIKKKKKDCQIVSQSVCTILPSHQNGFCCCSMSLSTFIVVMLCTLVIHHRYVVVFHCLHLHFPDKRWCEASFLMPICHLCIFFDEMFVKVFGPFFFYLICDRMASGGSGWVFPFRVVRLG